MASVEDHVSKKDGALRLLPLILTMGMLALVVATAVVAPMNGEDYALALPRSDDWLLHRLPRIVEKIISHAMSWNGRLGELLAILFLSLPRDLLVIVEVAAFASLIVVCLALANVKVSPLSLAFGLGLVWLLWPRMELMFWSTVVLNYLVPVVLSLLLMLVVSNEAVRGRVVSGRLSVYIGICVLAVLVGYSFENLPPAIALYIALMAYFARCGGRIARRIVLLAALVLVGWAALMALPSTGFRQGYYRAALDAPDLSVSHLVGRSVEVTAQFIESSLMLLVVGAVCAGLVLVKAWNTTERIPLLMLFVPAVMAVAGVAAAPYTEPRAFAISWSIMLVFVLKAFSTLDHSRALRVSVAVGCIGLVAAAQCLAFYADFSASIGRRNGYIRAAIFSPECRDGLPIELIRTDAPIRILNNREPWVGNALEQVSRYWGCKVTLNN